MRSGRADLAKSSNTGYLPEYYVTKIATDAGFKLEGKSEINANPRDHHDYPKGVWTLPPTLALGDKDRYLAIGESDCMTLRFVKPQGGQISAAPAEPGRAECAQPISTPGFASPVLPGLAMVRARVSVRRRSQPASHFDSSTKGNSSALSDFSF